MPLHPSEQAQIRALLTKILAPNLILNPLLKRLTLSSDPAKALQIYNMLHVSAPNDHLTYTYVLKACALIHAPHAGHAIHARTIKSGHASDLFVGNSVTNFYAAVADVSSARKTFSEIPSPDVVAWTSMISAAARNGSGDEALRVFASMDVRPNAMTLVSVLPACSQLRALREGRAVHGFCYRSFVGHRSNIILSNAVMDMYMNCGDSVAARNVFEEMPERDVVSWTTLVAGYARKGGAEWAIAAFRAMLVKGEAAPNEATLVSVLGACAAIGSLNSGKCMHAYACRSGIEVDSFVSNALINMYAKCGEVRMGVRAFELLRSKDLVSWCTIIGGMAANGMAKAALQLFSMMLCQGVRPDGVAFVAVLCACGRAGLVDKAAMIFKAIRDAYCVELQKEHYTCMLDAYGRAGREVETEALLRSMPMELDGPLWGALLSAFKTRRILGGEVNLGGGTYALMSNMLANAGKWEECHLVREEMRMRRISKTAGFSWMEVASI